MCGRFASSTPPERLAEEFEVEEVPEMDARYNIAPTQDVLTVRRKPDGREARILKWGLIPSWAKDPSMGARLINARSETVTEKPAFRSAFKKRRCLIPADGFYEWQVTSGPKQPFFIHMRDRHPFGFAGLWERWEGEDGRVVESCTILTTEANELMGPIHDRMPVILHPDEYELWLDEDVRKQDLRLELLKPYAASEMAAYPVSLMVNSPRHEGVELVQPLKVNSA